MPEVLDAPSRLRERITDSEWDLNDSSTVTPHRATLVGQVVSRNRIMLPFLNHRLTFEFEGPLPHWFRDVMASLNELARLPTNWDSYRAVRIRRSCLFATWELLSDIMLETTPAPAVVPTNRGTVVLEWHTRGIDLEVEVLGPGRLHVAFEDVSRAIEWESEIGSDLSRLVDGIRQLS